MKTDEGTHNGNSSRDFDWHSKEFEEFAAGYRVFKIKIAKKIIKEKPRAVRMFEVSIFSDFLEMFVVLDKRKRDYDTTFPVIVVTLKQGGKLLIDGWHRLQAAIKAGHSEIPAVVLTWEETQLVMKTRRG